MSPRETVSIEQVMDALNEFSVAYGGKFAPVDEKSFEVWYKHLRDLDAGCFKKACDSLIRTSKYSPTIADVREKYSEIWGDWSSHVSELNEKYRLTCAIWPGVTERDRADAKEIWDRWVLEDPEDRDSHTRKGNWIHMQTVRAIRELEKRDEEKGFLCHMRELEARWKGLGR